MTSQEVALTVQRALCLEALADKPGCTTRFTDLPGRPLEDFIVAGINVGPVFRLFAQDWLGGNETRLFHRFVPALKASNVHKSDKFVNFGLLEILFPAVASRLVCDKPAQVVPTPIKLMQQAPQSDVAQMVRARKLAWSTSEKRNYKLADLTPEAQPSPSPYAFYEAIYKTAPSESASHQWIDNYHRGLHLLEQQFKLMQQHADQPILQRIRLAYEPVRTANPQVRIGILADMSAAAIFLHLSFYY